MSNTIIYNDGKTKLILNKHKKTFDKLAHM